MAGSADASWQALPIAHRLARAQDQVKARAPGLERWRQQYRLSAHMKMDEASMGWVEPSPAGSRLPFRRNSVVGPTSRFQAFEGNPESGNIAGAGEDAWPCQIPPWGNLLAVNARTGDIAQLTDLTEAAAAADPALGVRLRLLVNAFDYEAILKLLG